MEGPKPFQRCCCRQCRAMVCWWAVTAVSSQVVFAPISHLCLNCLYLILWVFLLLLFQLFLPLYWRGANDCMSVSFPPGYTPQQGTSCYANCSFWKFPDSPSSWKKSKSFLRRSFWVTLVGQLHYCEKTVSPGSDYLFIRHQHSHLIFLLYAH